MRTMSSYQYFGISFNYFVIAVQKLSRVKTLFLLLEHSDIPKYRCLNINRIYRTVVPESDSYMFSCVDITAGLGRQVKA